MPGDHNMVSRRSKFRGMGVSAFAFAEAFPVLSRGRGIPDNAAANSVFRLAGGLVHQDGADGDTELRPAGADEADRPV